MKFRLSLMGAGVLALAVAGHAQSEWRGHSRDAQHSALSAVASQPLQGIRWQMPVDLLPQYNGDNLYIHYGSPVCTRSNTVIVPVKTGSYGYFRIEARRGNNGALKWKTNTDYILPPHSWIPSLQPALAPNNRVYFAGAGGTVFFRGNADATTGATAQLAFYGLSNYLLDTNAYLNSVFINTPITTDSAGNIFFGFEVDGPNPLDLEGGIARISSSGTGTWVTAGAAVADGNVTKPVHNCAPALSPDEGVVYIAVNSGNFTSGYLVALDSSDLTTIAKVRLKDPQTGRDSFLSDNGTSSPTVGPDGDVFFGVLENPFSRGKGWLLQFASDLTQTASHKPGAFGWDITASIVPPEMVPSYAGSSTYLVFIKYNNYAGLGGDGVNKIAVLDPHDSMIDSRTGVTVMKEVLTIAGVTPDHDFPNVPTAVREWCINTGVVDPQTKSILGNNEDGKLYRWNLVSNAFAESVTLTTGRGQAYTPTLIGPDGTVYAINNATLFAVGIVPSLPTVTILATDPNASEPGSNKGKFVVTRTGSTDAALRVNYKVSGTAKAGMDYKTLTGFVNILAPSNTATIVVKPKDDRLIEPIETVTVTISSSNTYVIGAASNSTVKVKSND